MPSNRKSRGSRHRSHKDHQKHKFADSAEYLTLDVEEEARLGPHLENEFPQWMVEETEQQPLPAWVEGPSVLSSDMAAPVSRGLKRKGLQEAPAAKDLSPTGFGSSSKRRKAVAAGALVETDGVSSTHSSLDRWDGGESRADEAFSLLTSLDSARDDSHRSHLKSFKAEARNIEAVGSSFGGQMEKGDAEGRNLKAKSRTAGGSGGSSSRPITVIDLPGVAQVDTGLGDANIRIKNKVSRRKELLEVPHVEAVKLHTEVHLSFSKEQPLESYASDSGKASVKKGSSTRKHDKNAVHSQSSGGQTVLESERKKSKSVGGNEASQKLRRADEPHKSRKSEMQNKKFGYKSETGDDSSEALDEHPSKSDKSLTVFELDLPSTNRNPELERELENRIRRRREESRDRWRDDEKDMGSKRHHRQADRFKESNRRKEDKNKSERHVDEKISSDQVNDDKDSSTGKSRDEKDREGRIKYEKQNRDKQKNIRQKNDKDYDDTDRDERHRRDKNRDDGDTDERQNDRHKEGKIKDDKDMDREDKDERWRHPKLKGNKHRGEKAREEKLKDEKSADERPKREKTKDGIRSERVSVEHDGGRRSERVNIAHDSGGRDLDQRLLETAEDMLGQREKNGKLKEKEKEKGEKQRPGESANEKEKMHKHTKGEDHRIDKYQVVNSVKVAKMPGVREKNFKHLDNPNNDKIDGCRDGKADLEVKKDGDSKLRESEVKDETSKGSKAGWNFKGGIDEHEKYPKMIVEEKVTLDSSTQEWRKSSKQGFEKYKIMKDEEDNPLEQTTIEDRHDDKVSNEKQRNESRKDQMQNDIKLKHGEALLESSAEKNGRNSVEKKQSNEKNADDIQNGMGLDNVPCRDDLIYHGREYKRQVPSTQGPEYDGEASRFLDISADEIDSREANNLVEETHEKEKVFVSPSSLSAIDAAQASSHMQNTRPVFDAAQRSPSPSYVDGNHLASYERSGRRIKSETTVANSNVTWHQRGKNQHFVDHIDRGKQHAAGEEMKSWESKLSHRDSDNSKRRSLSPEKNRESLPATSSLAQGETSRGSTRNQMIHDESGKEWRGLSQGGGTSKVRAVDDTSWERTEWVQHNHQTNRSVGSAIMRPQLGTFANRPSGPPGLLPPPPPLRPGIDNPAIISYEEGQGNRESGRYDRKVVGHYKRADIGAPSGPNDTWRGMGSGNWNGQNQVPGHSNMFSPFPPHVAVHPSSFVVMGQQYPLPHLFGRSSGHRPSPDMVFGSGRFHVADGVSGFHGPGPVMGWRRPGELDDTHRSLQGHLDTWEAPRMYADDRQRYGRPEWDPSSCLLNAGGGERGVHVWQGHDFEANPTFKNPIIQRQASYQGSFWNAASIFGPEQETKKKKLQERASIELSEESNKILPSSTPDVVAFSSIDKLSKRDIAKKLKLLLNLDISLELVGVDLYKKYLSLLPASEAARREYPTRQELIDNSFEDDFDLEPDVEAEALLSVSRPSAEFLQPTQGFMFQARSHVNRKAARKDLVTIDQDFFSCPPDDYQIDMVQVDQEVDVEIQMENPAEQESSLKSMDDLDNFSLLEASSIMIDDLVTHPVTESDVVENEHRILSVNISKQENCNAFHSGLAENVLEESHSVFYQDDGMVVDSSKLHYEALVEANDIIKTFIETILQLCESRERSSLQASIFGSQENLPAQCTRDSEEASLEPTVIQEMPLTAVGSTSELINLERSLNDAQLVCYSSNQEVNTLNQDQEILECSDEADVEAKVASIDADNIQHIYNSTVTKSMPEDPDFCCHSSPLRNIATELDETLFVRSNLGEICTDNSSAVCSTEYAVNLTTNADSNVVGGHCEAMDAESSQSLKAVEIEAPDSEMEEIQLETEILQDDRFGVVLEVATELFVGGRERDENSIPQQSLQTACENTR